MVATLLALPLLLAAQAETNSPVSESTFSYDYVEGSLGLADYDFLGDDGVQFAFKTSVAINETFNFVGSFSYEQVDVGRIQVENGMLLIGGGAHTPITEKVDLFGEAGIVFGRAEAFGDTGTSSGIGLAGGVRTMPAEGFEFDAALSYNSVFSDDLRLGLAGRGYLSETLALGVSLGFESDVSVYALTLRYDF